MPLAGVFSSFQGRIGRLTFLFASIVMMLFNSLMLWLLGVSVTQPQSSGLAVAALSLVLWWPALAIAVKRYHDLDMSGWWVALPTGSLLIILAGALMTVGGTQTQSTGIAAHGVAIVLTGLAGCLVCVWHLIKLLFFSGSPGTNRFGAAPRLAQTLFGEDQLPGVADTALPRDTAISRDTAAPQSTTVTRLARQAPRTSTGPARPAGFGKHRR